MTTRRLCWIACTGLAALIPAGLAAEPAGYSARAAIAIEATTSKGALSIAGDANFEQRGGMVRLDLLSLDLVVSGGKPPQIIPKGGYTVVYDPAVNRYTVWSAARRAYFTGSGKPSAPSPSASPTAAPSVEPTATPVSPLAKIKDLRAFSLSINLAPAKETVDGHVTTPFDFAFKAQGKAGEPSGLAGRVNFADDLSGVPILIVANATYGGNANAGKLRLSLTQVRESAPPETDFSPPTGYAKAASLFDVLVLPPGLGGPG